MAFHKQIQPLIPRKFKGTSTPNQWAAFATRSKQVQKMSCPTSGRFMRRFTHI